MPTLSSMKSIPAAAHVAASSSLIARDASAMSASPAQNLAKPSPVPGPSTETDTPGAMSAKASPTAIEIGSTVDDPVTTMSPLREERSADDSGAAVVPGAIVVAAEPSVVAGAMVVAGRPWSAAARWCGAAVVAAVLSSSSPQAASTRAAIAAVATNRFENHHAVAPFVFTVGRSCCGFDANARKPR